MNEGDLAAIQQRLEYASSRTTARGAPAMPLRCWDLNPELLRSLGAVDDFDIETHAKAELTRDVELGEEFALTYGLADDQKAAMICALKARHRSIWGRYSDA